MPADSSSDSFLWIGPSGGGWSAPANWKDLTTGDASASVAPGAGATVTFDGPASGAPLEIDGTGSAALLDLTGLVNFVGSFALNEVDLTAANAAMTVEGPSSASSMTIGTLVETGAGDTLTAIGTGTSITVNALGPVTQSITASANAIVNLPNNVTVNGGTLDAGPMSGSLNIGGTGASGSLTVFSTGVLSGSGSLLGQFDYVPPAGGLSGELIIGVAVAVYGTINSTGFTVYSQMFGSHGTINVEPDGFFTSAVALIGPSFLTFNIDSGGTLHLPSVVDNTETINFAQPDGTAIFYTDDYLENYGGFLTGQTRVDIVSPVTNFTPGDRIFVMMSLPSGFQPAVYTENSGSGVLSINAANGTTPFAITFAGAHSLSEFLITFTPNNLAVGQSPVTFQIDDLSPAVFALSTGSGAAHSYTWAAPSGGAWSNAANWQDTTAGGAAAIAPGAGDTASIVGSAGLLFTVVTQAGAVGTLQISNNVAAEGSLSVGALNLAATGAHLLVTNGGVIDATTLDISASGVVLEALGTPPIGAAGYVDVSGAATLGAGSVLAVSDGGRLQFGSLTILGGDGTTNTIGITPFDNAGITIGTANDASENVKIDAGGVLTDLSPANNPASIGSDVVDDGVLDATNLGIGGIDGDGAVTVEAGGTLNAATVASDASIAFTIDAGATLNLEFPNQVAGGSISFAGAGGSLSISGNGVVPVPNLAVPISGFAPGDSIEYEVPGGLNAMFASAGPAGGTLSLLNAAGVQVGSLMLTGNYANSAFVVTSDSSFGGNIALAEPGSFALSAGTSGSNFSYAGLTGGAWGDGANWSDTSTPATVIAPGINDAVTIAGGASNGLTLVTGSGNSASLTYSGNVALSGVFNTGVLMTPGFASASNALFIDPGTSLNASSAVMTGVYDPSITVNGQEAVLDIAGALSGFIILTEFGAPAITVENGGVVTIGSFALSNTSVTFGLVADNEGTFNLPTSLASNITIALGGNDNVLRFATPGAAALAVGSSISGFNATDTLFVSLATSVAGVSFSQASSAGGTLDLLNASGQTVSTLSFSGDFTGETFHALALSTTLTEISLNPLAPAPISAPNDFNADGKSDFLIENAGGAVVVGEVAGGEAGFGQVALLGPEWSFEGTGDFLGDGHADFLIENTAGAVVVGEVVGGLTTYTQVAALGSGWTFQGTGDFLGDGKSDFLIQNTSGALIVGEAGASSQAAFTDVCALGPEWSFKGTGDFLGDGRSDFLIENTNGTVVVGEIVGGQTSYLTVAGLGPEWKFGGTGDFLGDGKSDFLIESAAGAVDIGEVINGQAAYTPIALLGAEWSFKGTGDYLGEDHDQFLIENTAGQLVVADYTGGQIHYTPVASLGSQWAFH